MSRFTVVVHSPAALTADTAFAALVPGAGKPCVLRRLTFGVRAGAAPPTSQQIEIGLNRATTRGTPTLTVPGGKMEPASPAASGITGVDTAWSAPPALAADDALAWVFNTQAGADLSFEDEELRSDILVAHPLVFVNRANALPADHLLVLTIQWEEWPAPTDG